MLVSLTHPKLTKIHNSEVFEDISTIKELCSSIYQHSLREPILVDDSADPDFDPKERQKVFRGDAFEVFGEYVCRAYDTDSRIGVRSGEVVPLDEDVGVDFLGESTLGDGPVAVQFKFKSDPAYTFKLRELATYLATAGHLYGASGRNLILFTTGDGVNYKIRKVVPNIRVINRKVLCGMFDNNKGFWDDFLESLDASVKAPKKRVQHTLFTDQVETMDAIKGWMDN